MKSGKKNKRKQEKLQREMRSVKELSSQQKRDDMYTKKNKQSDEMSEDLISQDHEIHLHHVALAIQLTGHHVTNKGSRGVGSNISRARDQFRANV